MRCAHSQNRDGFTLVEISIVMIIIGLLIGGILKGQELVKSAEVSRAVTELKSMQAAIETFRSEYRAFPGDMQHNRVCDANWSLRYGKCAISA